MNCFTDIDLSRSDLSSILRFWMTPPRQRVCSCTLPTSNIAKHLIFECKKNLQPCIFLSNNTLQCTPNKPPTWLAWTIFHWGCVFCWRDACIQPPSGKIWLPPILTVTSWSRCYTRILLLHFHFRIKKSAFYTATFWYLLLAYPFKTELINIVCDYIPMYLSHSWLAKWLFC